VQISGEIFIQKQSHQSLRASPPNHHTCVPKAFLYTQLIDYSILHNLRLLATPLKIVVCSNSAVHGQAQCCSLVNDNNNDLIDERVQRKRLRFASGLWRIKLSIVDKMHPIFQET